MKLIIQAILIMGFFILSPILNSQNTDLREKVDSIIKYEIKYIPDSTTNVVLVRQWDSTKIKGLLPATSSLPFNPMTIIIVDGFSQNLDDLNDYSMSEVLDIKVYSKNDTGAMALYGTQARNGLILIDTERENYEYIDSQKNECRINLFRRK